MPSLLSPELRAQFASGTEEGSRLSYRQRRRNAVRNESSRPRRRIRTLDANWPNWNMARGKRRYGPDCTRSWTVLPWPTTNADHTNSNSLAKEPAAIQGLFIKSSELGKKFTKKQHLKHLRKKEQFGMQLTNEESEGTIVVYHHTSRHCRRQRPAFVSSLSSSLFPFPTTTATAAATNYNIENSSFAVVTKQREKKQTIRRGRNECRTLTTTMTTPQ